MTATITHIAADAIQQARAEHMRELFEPWSFRKLEGRTGIGRSSLQTKFSGSVPFTIGDIEILAPLVRMTPVELVAELYGITGTQKTPVTNDGGLGSVGPARIELTTSTVEERHLAPVTPLFKAAS